MKRNRLFFLIRRLNKQIVKIPSFNELTNSTLFQNYIELDEETPVEIGEVPIFNYISTRIVYCKIFSYNSESID